MKKAIALLTAASVAASMLCGMTAIAEDTDYSYNISVSAKASDGTELETIAPGSSFIAEVSVEEISERDSVDYFVVAEYGLTGKLMGIQYAYMDVSQSASFGITVPAQEEYVAELKAYAWDGLNSMTPLAASVSKEYEGYQQYDMMTYCAPYQYNRGAAYLEADEQYFTMAGDAYTNGFVLTTSTTAVGGNTAEALFNLKNLYQSVTFSTGHIDGKSDQDVTMEIYIDGELAESITLEYDNVPKKFTINLDYASQMKIKIISTGYYSGTSYGFANGIFE